jgi:hypothetical protein
MTEAGSSLDSMEVLVLEQVFLLLLQKFYVKNTLQKVS